MRLMDGRIIRFYFFIVLLLGTGSQTVFAEEKRLLGSINAETGHYTSTEKRFTVKLPISGSLEELQEIISDSVTAGRLAMSVSSSPKTTSYRIEVSYVVDRHLRDTTFEAATRKTFDFYRRLAASSFRGNMTELLWQPFKLRDNPAALAIYKQSPAQGSGPRYHLFHLADFGNTLGFVWTDIPLREENLAIEDAIIEGTAPPAQKGLAMLHSLKFK